MKRKNVVRYNFRLNIKELEGDWSCVRVPITIHRNVILSTKMSQIKMPKNMLLLQSNIYLAFKYIQSFEIVSTPPPLRINKKKTNPLVFILAAPNDATETNSTTTTWQRERTSGSHRQLGMRKIHKRWCSIKIGDPMDGRKRCWRSWASLLHGRQRETDKGKYTRNDCNFTFFIISHIKLLYLYSCTRHKMYQLK